MPAYRGYKQANFVYEMIKIEAAERQNVGYFTSSEFNISLHSQRCPSKK